MIMTIHFFNIPTPWQGTLNTRNVIINFWFLVYQIGVLIPENSKISSISNIYNFTCLPRLCTFEYELQITIIYTPVHRVPHDTNQRIDGVIRRHYIRDFVFDDWNGPQKSSHNTSDYPRRSVHIFQPTGTRFWFRTADWNKN